MLGAKPRKAHVEGPGEATVAELHRRAEQYEVAAEHLDEPFNAHATGIASGLRYVAEIERIDLAGLRARADAFAVDDPAGLTDRDRLHRQGHAEGLRLGAQVLADDGQDHHAAVCPECDWPGTFRIARGGDPPVEFFDCECRLVNWFSYDPRAATRRGWT